MTRWIIEKSVGFTVVGFLRISESVRAYAYLICKSQSKYSGRHKTLSRHLSYASSKVDYSAGESIYMLPSDLKLKIKTGTVGYSNKILVSNGNFILGKNEKVNSLEAPSAPQAETPAIKNHKTNSLETPTIKTHKTNPLKTHSIKSTQTEVNSERTVDLEQKTIISHEDEKVALVLSLTGIFMIWFIFR